MWHGCLDGGSGVVGRGIWGSESGEVRGQGKRVGGGLMEVGGCFGKVVAGMKTVVDGGT